VQKKDEQIKALHEKKKRLEQCLENSKDKRRKLQRKLCRFVTAAAKQVTAAETEEARRKQWRRGRG